MPTASLSKNTRLILDGTVRSLGRSLSPLRAAGGRLRYLSPFPRRFTGAYSSYEAAFAAAKTMPMAGYDHEEIANAGFSLMCQVLPWDYPVMFWMRNLMQEIDGVIDAGGHMGTKYRAFRPLLSLDESFRWIVYDLPSITRVGRRLAEQEGLTGLTFVDRIEDAGGIPLFLGSGLMQYLDVPLSGLLQRLPALPRHLILNKVAFHKSGMVVTLERISGAYVPYQMRDEATFLSDVTQLGYKQVDRWAIPSLSHLIDTHPELGRSESAGFYFRLG
ncbi:methyltransferase, TIGR04325 family [Rhizobium mayense]|uniref:Methyltransferase, TIGR04325 family n=1 Tax=Rhizobium mayense TaxID=1312184 RepID=A0ABT7K2E4_9HYPH|nr:methyltransferase, TIGR04325 family [Rhizobium mayense]MDL2401329.1 methyltransferase, TIGR04325 family [Rhizobium mayense]